MPVRPPHPGSTLFPYTTLFRSSRHASIADDRRPGSAAPRRDGRDRAPWTARENGAAQGGQRGVGRWGDECQQDRKSTRLNSSHVSISYAVFCLKKKKKVES